MLVVSEDMGRDCQVKKRKEAVMQTEDVDRVICVEIVTPFEVGEGARVLLSKLFPNVLPVPLDWSVACTFAPDERGSDRVYTSPNLA